MTDGSTALPTFRAGVAVLELAGDDVCVHVWLGAQVPLEGVEAGDMRSAIILCPLTFALLLTTAYYSPCG